MAVAVGEALARQSAAEINDGEVCKPSYASFLTERLRDTRVQVLSGCPHLPHRSARTQTAPDAITSPAPPSTRKHPGQR
jgi:hypothetical protein